jgi:hypothetical protein
VGLPKRCWNIAGHPCSRLRQIFSIPVQEANLAEAPPEF